MKYAIGLDIGGTKVACGLINELGEVEESFKIKSDTSSPEAMFACVCHAVDVLLAQIDIPAEQLAIGAGVPGLVDAKAGIAIFQNNLSWTNFPFTQRMKERFPKIKTIIIDNDVYQATFAEWKMSGLDADATLTFLTASTGVSCATITGGKFIRGRGFAGEVGLLPLQNSQGQTTTLENLVGGNHLAEQGRLLLQDDCLTTRDLFEGFYAGNVVESALILDWLKNFSYGLFSILCVVDPHRLVLGGSIPKLNPQLLPLIKAEVKRMMLPVQYDRLDAIVLTQFDNNVGLIGAGLSAM